MDRLTKEQRSALMARVRTANTDIENLLSECVRPFWEKERYRKNPKNITGKPDIVFPKSKVIVFADGDFWHGKDFEKWKDGIPPFWRKKIASNIKRDNEQNRLLRREGYGVLRFWGSSIKKNPKKVTDKIQRKLIK